MSHVAKKIPATQIKNNFGHYLTEVMRLPHPIFIEKHGQAVAVLVSMKHWQEVTGEKLPSRRTWIEACTKLAREIAKNKVTQTPAVELVRQLREES